MNERRDIETLSDAETEDLARIIRAAGRRPAPPQADYDTVFAAAHAAWQAKLRARSHSRWSYALAATLLVAISAALLWPLGTGTPAPVATARLIAGDVAVFAAATGTWLPVSDAAAAPQIRAGDRVRTAEGGRIELELLPSMSLRLAEQTEIEIGGEHALRLIAGTAYVDSGHAPHALRFETAFGTLRDIGTQFEVRLTATSMRLRVRSGRVELMPTNGPSTYADAEEQIELTRGGRLARVPFPAAHAEWAWVESLAVVPLAGGRPHIEYLTWIASETGRTLAFDSDAARLFAQTDTLAGEPRGLAPDELLDVIVGSTRLARSGTDTDREILITLEDIR